MKVQFHFNINDGGEPMISFRHHDKSNTLDQKLLLLFIKLGEANGLELVRVAQSLGDGVSFDEYVIKPKIDHG